MIRTKDSLTNHRRLGTFFKTLPQSLGNHEFDDGIEGLVPFVEAANHPVLAANIDTTKEDRVHGKIPKSVVINVAGRDVGIIGFLTAETTVQSFLLKCLICIFTLVILIVSVQSG
jgi:hypothetical protein